MHTSARWWICMVSGALLAGCAGKAAVKREEAGKQAPPPSAAVAPVKAAEPAAPPAPAPAPPEVVTLRPDEEGFIKDWLLLPPIMLDESVKDHTEDSEKEFLNKEYFANQMTATPKAGDKAAVGGNSLAWKKYKTDEFVDFMDAFDDIDEEAKNTALFVGVTYFVCDKDIPNAKLMIGSDDSSVWRLDGKEVIRVYSGRAVDKDQDASAPLVLRKGPHVLSFSVINGDGPTGACARFLDDKGNPVTGYAIKLSPPEGLVLEPPR